MTALDITEEDLAKLKGKVTIITGAPAYMLYNSGS